MSEVLTNRGGESITVEQERQILDSINRWLDRDVKDKVLDF